MKMGLRGLLIPDALQGELAEILRGMGATVEVTREPFEVVEGALGGEGRRSRGRGAEMVASTFPQLGTFRILCVDARPNGLEGWFALFYHASWEGLRIIRSQERQWKEIEAVLRQHGGVDPPRREERGIARGGGD
jgi:hypothetical protein